MPEIRSDMYYCEKHKAYYEYCRIKGNFYLRCPVCADCEMISTDESREYLSKHYFEYEPDFDEYEEGYEDLSEDDQRLKERQFK